MPHALTFEGRIEPHPGETRTTGTFFITIGDWRTLSELAESVTRAIRRHAQGLPPFTAGPPQRVDFFSYDTLAAGRRVLAGEPERLRLFGPVNLALSLIGRRVVADPNGHRSRFEAGDFDFAALPRAAGSPAGGLTIIGGDSPSGT